MPIASAPVNHTLKAAHANIEASWSCCWITVFFFCLLFFLTHLNFPNDVWMLAFCSSYTFASVLFSQRLNFSELSLCRLRGRKHRVYSLEQLWRLVVFTLAISFSWQKQLFFSCLAFSTRDYVVIYFFSPPNRLRHPVTACEDVLGFMSFLSPSLVLPDLPLLWYQPCLCWQGVLVHLLRPCTSRLPPSSSSLAPTLPTQPSDTTTTLVRTHLRNLCSLSALMALGRPPDR